MSATATDVAVAGLAVHAYEIPVDAPGGVEADGTLEWSSTTCVVVEAHGGGRTGAGYTYGPAAVGTFVCEKLAAVAAGADALAPRATHARMCQAARNAGTTGIGAMAISAVDAALWDLAARLLELPLVTLLGEVREAAEPYGSGGFCNLPRADLQRQLEGWVAQGLRRVKIKVGRDPEHDEQRVHWARGAVGDDVELFVDANGAYTPAEARRWARRFGELGVTWLEEPLSSDDLDGLALLRRAGAAPAIAAGEYGWDLPTLERLLDRDAVDVLQPDVTRCGGFTTFLRADALCRARNRPLSAHCAPAQSVHAVCACETAVHLEFFHDHTRIEPLLFDGVLEPGPDGLLRHDRTRPGNGLELKRADAEPYAL